MRRWFAIAIVLIAGSGRTPAECTGLPAPRPGGKGVTVLAEYHVWHGLPSHASPAFDGAPWLPYKRAYDSRDPQVIARHIREAKARGIHGFVVDWEGPASGVANDADRKFMDDATGELFRQAEAARFRVALMYDEGTVSRGESKADLYQARVLADLSYARKYFRSRACLRLNGRPALFVFPYPDVDPFVDWAGVRRALKRPFALISKGPNPDDPRHDDQVDGMYAWVGPSGRGWDPMGLEWGQEYLEWFYSTMKSPRYAGKILVGGVWPGFDDSLAAWAQMRFMSRQGTRVHEETWRIAQRERAPIVMIATWNDFEEGTDIEFGVLPQVDMEAAPPEILLRSSPVQVRWNPARGPLTLQVYRDGQVIYERPHEPGVFLSLESNRAYEIKVWPSASPLAKVVKIRRQDPVPGVVPVVVD